MCWCLKVSHQNLWKQDILGHDKCKLMQKYHACKICSYLEIYTVLNGVLKYPVFSGKSTLQVTVNFGKILIRALFCKTDQQANASETTCTKVWK